MSTGLIRTVNPGDNSTTHSNQDRVRLMLDEIKKLPQEEQKKCLEIALRLLDAQASNVDLEATLKELGERITSYTKTTEQALVTAETALEVVDRTTEVAQSAINLTQDAINVTDGALDIAQKTQKLAERLMDLIEKDSENYKHINTTLDKMEEIFADLKKDRLLNESHATKRVESEKRIDAAMDRMDKIFDKIKERENKSAAAKASNLHKAAVLLTPVFFFSWYIWLYASKKSLASSGAVKLLTGKTNGNLNNRYATILPALGKDKIRPIRVHSLKQEESPLFMKEPHKESRLASAESSLIQAEPKEMEQLRTSKPEKNKGRRATPRKIGSQISQSTRAISKKLSEFFIPRSKL